MLYIPSRSRRQSLIAAVLTGLLAAAAPADTFINPVVPRGGDPFATQWMGQYFYTATTGSNVRIGRSPWLQSLNSNSRRVWDPPPGLPYSSNLWAPELHRVNDKWYLYVAADDGVDANHRMYVLEADSQDPQASYTLKGQISIPDNRWAIDGTVFAHGDKNYFIWSGRRYSSGGEDWGSAQSLFIAEMLNPWTLTGNRVAISHPTYSWERHGHAVNEGPQILTHGDDVFLTYSASGFYTPQYAIGALKLTGSNPLSASSWTKISTPLFDQGNGAEGTGHATFVQSPDGTEDWIVYHARTAPEAARDVRIQPFTWGADGRPQFGDPLPISQSIPTPSGMPLVRFIPNLSFERGGAGWLDDFRVIGDAGSLTNDGSHFTRIEGGDGPRIGYLAAGSGAAIYQDIGPAHAGTYELSVGLALSDDQLAAVAASPASFMLRLHSVGLHPGGSADESDQVLLGQTLIDSSALSAAAFAYFDVQGIVPDGARVGSWLRVELASTGQPQASPLWHVKLDLMQLDFTGPASTIVPEPAAALPLAAAGLLLGRRRRHNRAHPPARSPIFHCKDKIPFASKPMSGKLYTIAQARRNRIAGTPTLEFHL